MLLFCTAVRKGSFAGPALKVRRVAAKVTKATKAGGNAKVVVFGSKMVLMLQRTNATSATTSLTAGVPQTGLSESHAQDAEAGSTETALRTNTTTKALTVATKAVARKASAFSAYSQEQQF